MAHVTCVIVAFPIVIEGTDKANSDRVVKVNELLDQSDAFVVKYPLLENEDAGADHNS